MANYLPHWPHDDQDVVNRMTGEQWFVRNYYRLRRTLTRAELFHPYIPADILEDRPDGMDPRMREALEYLIQDAEDEAIALMHEDEAHEFEIDMEVDSEDEEMSVIEISADEDDEYVPREHMSTPEIIAEIHNIERAASAAYQESLISEAHTSQGYAPCPDGSPSCLAGPSNHEAINDESMPGPSGFNQRGKQKEIVQGQETHSETRDSVNPNVSSVWPSVPALPPLAEPEANLDQNVGPVGKGADQQGILVDIVAPQDRDSRRNLIESFRLEILHDWVHDTLLQNGVNVPHVSAFDLHSAQMEEALSNLGLAHGRPYVHVNHFVRHDWHPRTGNCVYTVQSPIGRERGSAEELEVRFSGVRHAIWSYWGERGHVRRHNIVRYCRMSTP
jgi:hypothetical protein